MRRRVFVGAAIGAAGTGLLGLGVTRARACGLVGADAPSSGRIAPATEPGEPMQIQGRIYAPDGTTPAAGVVLYAYHTDLRGLYNPTPNQPPRLRGWLRSDADGRYTYRTIRPAPYPDLRFAAHVHVQLWGHDIPAQWATTLLFAGDPLISPAEHHEHTTLGRFGPIRPLTRHTDGTWHATHDLRLKPTGDVFEEHTRHGLRG